MAEMITEIHTSPKFNQGFKRYGQSRFSCGHYMGNFDMVKSENTFKCGQILQNAPELSSSFAQTARNCCFIVLIIMHMPN